MARGIVREGERIAFALTSSAVSLLFLLIFVFVGLRFLARKAPAPVSSLANTAGNLASYR